MFRLCVHANEEKPMFTRFIKYLFLCNKKKINCFFMHDITLLFVLFVPNIMKSYYVIYDRLTSEKGEGLCA